MATTFDLAEVRRNLVRLSGVQAALFIAILLAWRFLGGLDATLALWLAVLPILVAAWSYAYYRALQRADASGDGQVAFTAANKRALSLLGILGFAWFAGLLVVFAVSLF